MRFGTWNVGTLQRAGLHAAADREWASNKFEILGVEEVRWDKGRTVRERDYNFCWKGKQSPFGIGLFSTSQNRISS
jgi:exonuclease III